VAFSWVLQDKRNKRSILPLRQSWMVCLAETEWCTVLGFKTTPCPRAGCVWLIYFVVRSTFRNEPLTSNTTAPYVPSYLYNMPLGCEFHRAWIWVPQIDSPYHTFHQESLQILSKHSSLAHTGWFLFYLTTLLSYLCNHLSWYDDLWIKMHWKRHIQKQPWLNHLRQNEINNVPWFNKTQNKKNFNSNKSTN
jgi:hypothetical protein